MAEIIYTEDMNWWVLWHKRIHVSWLLTFAGAGIVGGVVLAYFLAAGATIGFVWLVVGLVLVVLGCLFQRIVFALVVLVGGCLIGLYRGSLDQYELTAYKALYGKSVTLKGSVKDDTEERSGSLVVRLSNVSLDDSALPGTVWVTVSQRHHIKRGDIVVVSGKLKEGFGTIPATMYRAEVVSWQRPEPGDVARRLRDGFADAVRTGVEDPQASLGIGYLTGQKRALPPDLSEALQITGLTHIVVASGYNLTILVRFSRRLFAKVSRYTALLSSAALIGGFVLVTGNSPSMSRASLVAGLSLLAWYYGRRFHPVVLLTLTAAATVLVNPSYAWGDVGWLLSFAAFAGVMLLAPLLQAYFFGKEKPGVLRQIAGETISAQIVTAPILMYTFGSISIIAVVANLLVLPFVPLAMLLTFIAGIAGLVLPEIAQILAAPAQWLLNYMVWVVEKLAELPWAQVGVQTGIWLVVGMYVAMIAAGIYLWCKTKYSLRSSNIVE